MSSESLVLLRRGTDPGDPYSYTINSVDVEDTGLYSCVAGNILGETVNIAHLEVNRGHPASHRVSKYILVIVAVSVLLASPLNTFLTDSL